MPLSLLYMSLRRTWAIVRFRYFRGVDLVLGKEVHLAAPWSSSISCATRIGDYTRVNGSLAIRGQGRVVIGKYAAIGHDLRIIVSNHDMSKANLQLEFQSRYGLGDLVTSKGEVVIGNNVWIGDSVLILTGVNIGDGAVIGGRSVVTRSVPPFSVAVGVPAAVIRKRFSDEVIAQLLEIRWWNWPEEKIRQNREFFSLDLTSDPEIDLSRVIR